MLRQTFRTGFMALALGWLAGCAGPGGLFNAGNTAPPFRDPAMSMQTAASLVLPGQSSKADVQAALGKTREIKFDSGYEVWVYRAQPARGPAGGRAEFVVLFTPAGIVKKTRIRPAYDVPAS
ncbi:MAG: hypothetical protein V4772_24960 [Pseudomonadota bacterium]